MNPYVRNTLLPIGSALVHWGPLAFAAGILLGTFTASCGTTREIELPACRLDWSQKPPCTYEDDETTCAYICTVRLHGRRIIEVEG